MIGHIWQMLVYLYDYIFTNIMSHLCESYNTQSYQISVMKTGARVAATSTSSIAAATAYPQHGHQVHSTSEMDSHADTTVAGKNCVVLHYTGTCCTVEAYDDAIGSKEGVPIVQAATGYTAADGSNYILILNQALYMPEMRHTLINPNQMRAYNVEVQDNPYDHRPLMISTSDPDFIMCMKTKGTTVYFDSWAPSERDLHECPHIVLTSEHLWDPQKLQMPSTSESDRAELEHYNVSSLRIDPLICDQGHSSTSYIYDHHRFNHAVISTIRNVSGSRESKVDTNDSHFEGTHDVLTESSMRPMKSFISDKRHSDVTQSDLSDRWNISESQAAMTLKATTQRVKRSAIMPLSRRYRVDRMFTVKRLRGVMATDTMHGRSKTIHGYRYAQVFGNRNFFVEAYPIERKADAGAALNQFVADYGAPDTLKYDGSKEQVERGTVFQKMLTKYDIRGKRIEPERPNQNPAESCIRELRKKWYRVMFRSGCPKELWGYGLPHIAKIMQRTASYSGTLDGRTPLEDLTGETPDISEYLDFGFYDWVWYKENAGIGESKLGKFIGISSNVGSLMSYWVLPSSGKPESRTTVQRVTELELQEDANRARITAYNAKLQQKLKHADTISKGTLPEGPEWQEYLDDPDFVDEFHKTFNCTAVKDADDDFSPDSYDEYINMEVALDRGGAHPELARVTKRLKNKDGIPIGTRADNPIVDSRLYEVEYLDGHRAAMTANVIAENIFSQVDEEGYRHVLLDEIIDHRALDDRVSKEKGFITTSAGVKRRVQTTKGWDILIQWKDGSTTWNKLKDVKDSYPVQLAEYAKMNGIDEEPAFAWWVGHVTKKGARIVSKIKSKYWVRTHKYGIRIPKTVKEALEIDAENGNTLWWDAILMEMKNVRPAFEKFDGDVKSLKGYQKIRCHMIFDVKLGENFRRKARYVAGGHTTDTPSSITYSSVVSRESVRIALTIAALNDLDLLACDIQNAYLTAKCREKIYTIAGPEFGSEQGATMIVKMALYGLKSSGAAFRSKLAGVLHEMGFRPSKADPDVWMRPATKPSGFRYYEYVLCYVDDVLSISHEPMKAIDSIKSVFKLKGDKAEIPTMYLGAEVELTRNENDTKCWTVSSEKYIKSAVANVEEKLAKEGKSLPTKCPTPFTHGYHPSEDVSMELNPDGLRLFQELIGVLRWGIELGRIDILLEVALLSSHLALPRIGHLEQVYHIFGYLKKSPRRRLYMDPDHPVVSENRFHKFDWEDFYKDCKEDVPADMPEPLGNQMSTHCFVDASHASDKVTRRSQTGILIFCNRSPTVWHSKRQNSVEVSTFGSEFMALKNAIELIKGLRYKLRMFGVPIEGPTNIFCDNEAVYKNASTPESVLSKKQHSIAYHYCREAIASGVGRLAKEDTMTNLSDLFTKTLAQVKREELLDNFMY